MKRALLLAAAIGAMALMPFTPARAADGVTLQRSSALLGEHIAMQLRVTAPAGAIVELTPGTPTWSGVELVSVDEVTQVPQGGDAVWFIQATVAAFVPGEVAFAPTVAIVQGAESTSVTLPAVPLTAVSTLGPDAELVLSPLAPPREIDGAESPLLRPAIAGGVVLGAVVLGLGVWFAARWAARRLRRLEVPEDVSAVPPSLEGAEQVLHSDPVAAYRLMASVVKTELARRYNVRATALTSTELRRRLEAGGERWQARLVGGLLEECDSVIYAGYRPAAERRQADLTMAREIVEAAS